MANKEKSYKYRLYLFFKSDGKELKIFKKVKLTRITPVRIFLYGDG